MTATTRFAIAWLAATVTLTAGSTRRARAQACCLNAGALTPGRLAAQEDALLGVSSRWRQTLGSFTPGGAYQEAPANTDEETFETDILGTFRVARRFEIGGLARLLGTRRALDDTSAWGGGLGDTTLSVRADVITPDDDNSDGFAFSAFASQLVPTGKPVDQATGALATDATGAGAFETTLGVWLDRSFDAGIASASVWAAQRSPVQGRHFGARVGGLVAAAWTPRPRWALTTSLATYQQAAGHTDNGGVAPDDLRLTTASLALGGPLSYAYRWQVAFAQDVPWRPFGRNETAGRTIILTALRGW